MKYILFLIVMIFALPVVAGGDKNRNASPVLGDGNCIYEAPLGIDLDLCRKVEASDNSQVIYFCDFESYVICPVEFDDD